MISIITTAYNNKDYIKDSIESMISSVGDIEYEILLGIDNCYKTLESVKRSLLNTKYNLKIYFFDNKPGTYIIRNTLVNETKYEKIIFFDSDDVMKYNMVLDVNHFLDTHDLVRPMFKTFKDKIPLENKPTYQYSFGAFGINKTKFLSLNGFEPWVCAADGEFIWRCDMNNFKVKNLQTISFFYRRHENSLTTNSQTNMKSNMRKEYHKIREMKKQNNNFRSLDKLSVDKYRKIDTKVEFTIIIPTYNVINYLTECLVSVIKSIKDLNVEVLVGIDGCEKTLSYIQKSSFDPRIRFYYFNQNVGPYIVKNSLSLISNSDYLMFFDSDDIMKDELVQDIIRYKLTHKLIKPMYLDFNEEVKNINLKISNSNTYGEGVFGIEKKIFLDMNGFEGWRCAADSDLMKRFYKNNVKLIHTKSLGFYRRVHKNSLTQHSDTNLSSQMRGKYYNISKKRNTFGPLPKLITERFQEVSIEYTNNTIIDEFKIVKDDIKTLLTDVLKLNVKSRKENSKINYDLINNIQNRKDIYHPFKDDKPKQVNKPLNRNEIFELKKGTLAEQNLRMFGGKKKNRF
jgi:glycosyltransferase involved in cell wall biosynthesis